MTFSLCGRMIEKRYETYPVLKRKYGIIKEIISYAKAVVTLEDGEAEADKLAAKYNMKKEDLLKEFGGLDMIMYDLEVRKVFDKLKEYNK